MNQSRSFVRKVIYITLIGLLLVPISLVSLPSSVSEKSEGSTGGELAQLRSQYELAQDRLSQIDPASETMKLASLGLRGIAVNLLWGQAIEHKKMQRWDQLEATLNMLIKVQPNFVKVWEYQAHNLAYNVSVEFDDYEYRYHWVKKGIRFLTEGIGYNIRDHRIRDTLGFFEGMKIGTSDEKDQFRRMFRVDEDYAREMAEFVEPSTYLERDFGYDNWKKSYQWYDQSRKMVDSGTPKYSSDWFFYMRRPAQLRNMGLGLQRDFRSGDSLRVVWERAKAEWAEYGKTPLDVGVGTPVTMEGIAETEEKLERLRRRLDELIPGVRQEFMSELKRNMILTEEQRIAFDLPSDQRSDVQQFLVRAVEKELAQSNNQIDEKVLVRAPEAKRVEAKAIYDQIMETLQVIAAIDRNQVTSNYRYWKELTEVESTNEAIAAHAAMFDATELQRQSIFDDEYQLDPLTQNRTITSRGAISYFMESFEGWQGIMDEHSLLRFGKLADSIVDVLKEYERMLKVTGSKWPKNHPLQAFLDYRKAEEDDGLPTTADLIDLYPDDEELLKKVDGQTPQADEPPPTNTDPSSNNEAGTPPAASKQGASEQG